MVPWSGTAPVGLPLSAITPLMRTEGLLLMADCTVNVWL